METTTHSPNLNDDKRIPNELESAMVRLADTVRTLHIIGYRIRNGLSSDQLPDPVLRDYDYIGSTSRIDCNRDHIVKGLYNAKQKPRKRASYEPYL